MCSHAMLLGAYTATCEASSQVMAGEETVVSVANGWSGKFREVSCQSAAAVTPLGGYLLQKHLIGEETDSNADSFYYYF